MGLAFSRDFCGVVFTIIFFSKKYTFFASRNSLRCGTAPVPRGIRAANRSGTGIDGVVAVTACGFSQMKTHTHFSEAPRQLSEP